MKGGDTAEGRSQCHVPTNWQSFLRNDRNKIEFFHFLQEQIMQIETKKIVVSASEGKVLCLYDQNRYIKLAWSDESEINELETKKKR